jgi:P pilus assembly chaperone PapD
VATQTIYVMRIVLTPTAAGGVLVLKNKTQSPSTKIDLRAATSGESKDLDLTATPMLFESGINVGTLTNAVATLFTSTTGKVG